MQKIDYSADETLSEEVFTQKRTTTSWINYVLRSKGMKINDMRTDLTDGTVILSLLSILMGKEISGHSKPKMRAQFLQNCAQAILTVKETLHIKLSTFISPEDFMVGSVKTLLDFFWDLIDHFHLKKIPITVSHPRGALLPWAQERLDVPEYDILPKNLTTDWKDGSAMYALVDSLNKGSLGFKSRSKDPLTDTTKAIEYANKTYGIPMLMDPQDIISAPDDLSMIIYLSFFQQYVTGIKPVVDEFVETKWYALQKPKPEMIKPKPKPPKLKLKVEPEKPIPVVDPSKCTLAFPPFITNTPTGQITISVRDVEGQLTNHFEAMDIFVTFTDGSKIPIEVQQTTEKGVYVVKLPPLNRVGKIVVIARIDNVDIMGCPFVSYCTPEFELSCTLIGSGSTKAFAQSPTSFYIQTTKNGALHTVPTDALSIQITGRKQVTPTVVSLVPGIMQVSFVAFKKGQYILQGSLFGKPFVKTNHIIYVAPDSIPEPMTSATTAALRRAYKVVGLNPSYVQNVPFSFKLVPTQQQASGDGGSLLCGNQIYGFAFGGKEGSEEVPVDVVEEENGRGEEGTGAPAAAVLVVTVIPLYPGYVDIDLAVGEVPLLETPLGVEILAS